MKRKLKSLLALALCAVGLSAFAKEPDAVQLWEGGPYFATCNIGAEKPEDYGILTNFNDAAQAVTGALGADWRVPSKEEFEKLTNTTYCTSSWDDTKKGYTFTGKGDYSSNSIFLPAAGYDYGQGCKYAGSKGYYWSSKEVDASRAWYLLFYQGSATVENKLSRSSLASVRAVRDTPPPPPALAVANVTTATHWPWDGKIDVTCDLTGSGKVQLSAALTTNGVTVCTAKAENVTGATTINLDAAGGVTNGVKFTWNAKADCPAGFNSTDTKVKVTAEKVEKPEPAAGVQLWANGPFFAECNVGATKPEEYGALYKFDDAAKAVTDALGSDWHLPSDGELKMLAGNNDGDKVCSNVWTTCNGVAGCRFFGMTSGYEDKNIFLPAAGVDHDNGDGREAVGSEGYYWSSKEGDGGTACLLYFYDGYATVYFDNRSNGLSVRAVRDAK